MLKGAGGHHLLLVSQPGPARKEQDNLFAMSVYVHCHEVESNMRLRGLVVSAALCGRLTAGDRGPFHSELMPRFTNSDLTS